MGLHARPSESKGSASVCELLDHAGSDGGSSVRALRVEASRYIMRRRSRVASGVRRGTKYALTVDAYALNLERTKGLEDPRTRGAYLIAADVWEEAGQLEIADHIRDRIERHETSRSYKPFRVYLVKGSSWSGGPQPGYYYVVAKNYRGDMVLSDEDRASRPGELAYGLAKTPRGGAPWFLARNTRPVRQGRRS